jgi:uncharacterized repeat protein (TIGR03803 family)
MKQKSVARIIRWKRLARSLFNATAILLCFRFEPPASAVGTQVLHGNRPSIMARLAPVEPLSISNHLNLAIALPLRNTPELTNLLRQIYDPDGPNYHHYLTPAQFAERFGPTEKDYQAVVAFAKASGLTVTGTHPNRTLVDVNGSVASIEKAFHVTMRWYHHPTEKRDFYAPDTEPSLNLSTPILAVIGLNNFYLPHPMGIITNFFNQPFNAVPYATGSGPRSNFIGRDFREAYAPDVALDGSGQAVGLFELDGYYPGDIADYENLAGLPNVPLINVLVNGFNPNAPGGNNVEVALDIDMAIAMAPGLSKVIVYEGHVPNDVLNQMATDDSAKQLSCSWGFGSQVDPVREQIFEQFAAQGQSFFQASGDYGADAIYPPSDDPFVTVVGGTSLTTTNGAWQSETTWSGSGGGISANYSIPVWQQDVDMSSNQGSTTMRNLPDVACLADPSIWLVANNGEEGVVGGTSAAAPLWAGFTALLNEQAAANHQANIGFLNPAIYSIGTSSNQATAFHDITIGNNTNAASQNEFFAVPGYDLCTGWGTPDGTNLVNALRPAPDTLHITPATSVTFIGPVGGAFNPVAQTFHLTNNGASTLNWSLGNTSVWFNVSPAGGSLSAGAGAVISITPTTSVNVLAAGQYTATLFFADLNDGFSFDRQIRLNVVNPIETAAGVAFSNLYSFSGGSDDGANPNGLMQSSNGVLYGTTQNGGSNSYGTIFQLTTNGVLTNLYSFTGGDDGANPFDTPMQDAGGNFYGTTFQAGQYDNGTIFRLAPDGRFTTLLAFDITNGDLPFAGLTAGADGNFYGTTYQGGAYGRGTAYRLTASGVLTTLYSFANGSDGGHIAAGLIEGSDGNFYGTTWKGGDYGVGTVFSISTNRTLTTLASFDNTNGAFPFGGLAQDATGNFYGVASQGGAFGDGTVFKITPAGQLTNLYSFTGGGDGANPRAALLLGADGNFYGSTANGGVQGNGTIFVISPDGTLTTLVVFNGLDGANPQAALTQGNDGRLYGTTHNGGVNNKGVIFRFGITSAPQITSQPVNRSVFAGADVEFSVSVLGNVPLSYQWQKNGTNLTDGGVVFGSTNRILQLANVTTNDAGIYSVIVTNALGYTNSLGASLAVTSSPPFIVMQPTNQTLAAGETASFSVRAFGNLPLIYHWQKNGTNLADGGNVSGSTSGTLTLNDVTVANEGEYAVVVSNMLDAVTSSNVALTVVEDSVPGTALATLHWFNNNSGGWQPNGLMLAASGELYGTTRLGSGNGGSSAWGTIFKITTNGQFTTLISFNYANQAEGSFPEAALVQDTNGNFYGTTSLGGTNYDGNIFQLTPDNALANLYSFTGGDDGDSPDTPLIFARDGYLYGVTTIYGGGNIFRIATAGGFTNVASLAGAPAGALLQAADGNFYGMTSDGGNYDYGAIFKMTPAGTLTNIYSFSGGPDGYDAVGALIQGTDGGLYGVTELSSTNLAGMTFTEGGTIFRITTNGVKTVLHEFQTGLLEGVNPYAGLIQGSDGNFYGTTYGSPYNGNIDSGPTPINGTVFRLAPDGTLTTLVTFDGFDDGANPASVLVEGLDGALYGTTTAGGPNNHGTIFRLSFTTAPQITSQPEDQTVIAGAGAAFSVAVSGAPPLFYQWQKDGTNLFDGGNILGSTNRILTLANVHLADTGNYSVIVSNSLGSVTSSNALLAIIARPTFQSITQSNGVITLVWNAVSGQEYQLQYNSDLSSTNWIDLGNTITATNDTVRVSDIIGSDTRRFYRIKILFER